MSIYGKYKVEKMNERKNKGKAERWYWFRNKMNGIWIKIRITEYESQNNNNRINRENNDSKKSNVCLWKVSHSSP